MNTSVDLTGVWQIDDGSSKYNVQLTHKQDHVVGMYDFPPGSHGHIDGFVRGNVFDFQWEQPHNQRHGQGELIIEPDGNTLTGTWRYDPDSGLSGGGQWVFRRTTTGQPIWRSMEIGLSSNGWVSVTIPEFPLAMVKSSWLIGMIDGQAKNAVGALAELGDWANRKNLPNYRLLVVVFKQASKTNIDAILQHYEGNRMGKQAVGSVIHLASGRFYGPELPGFDLGSGLHNKPYFDSAVAQQIQDALDRALGPH